MRARFFAAALSAAALCIQTSGAQEQQSGASVVQENGQKPVTHVRLSKFIGSNIQTKDGVGLGKIEDVVVNPQTGQVQFALVAKGDFSGLGEKFVHVPWTAMNIKAE